MREPVWISKDLILAVHERQLAEHGGGEGVRDEGMLESALARSPQKFAYAGATLDMIDLAAAYAFGLSRNHPFVDGSKPTAAVSCELFLVLNGYHLLATDEDLYHVFFALAAGELDEVGLAEWLRRHARPDQVSETSSDYG